MLFVILWHSNIKAQNPQSLSHSPIPSLSSTLLVIATLLLIMARSSQSQDMPSKRHFHWTNKVATDDEAPPPSKSEQLHHHKKAAAAPTSPAPRRKLSVVAVCRLRSVLAALSKNRSQNYLPLGNRVVGTLFGCRRGHVHFAFQKDPTSPPALLIELATPISGLVKEMASGLVRIALECEKHDEEKGTRRLLEEPAWKAYCNGKKCGSGARRECGDKEWKVLKAVEPITTGAGVLPMGEEEDQVMYMRAKFERVVGSRDSEAFYMINPDTNGAPELSVYLLRV